MISKLQAPKKHAVFGSTHRVPSFFWPIVSPFETNILPEESGAAKFTKKHSFKSLRGSSTILREVCFWCLFAPLKTFWQKIHPPKSGYQKTNYQHHWRFPCLAPCCSPSGRRLFCDTTHVGGKAQPLGDLVGQDSMFLPVSLSDQSHEKSEAFCRNETWKNLETSKPAGGNSKIFWNVHPRTLGRSSSNLTSIFFKGVGATAN